MPAAEGDAGLAPQAAHEGHGFLENAQPVVDGDAARLELGAHRRHLGGDAEAENQAALAEQVEVGGLVGHDDRVAQRRQQHRSAHLDAPGAGGNRRQGGEGFQPRPRQDAVARPHRVEAERLGALRQIDDLAHVGGRLAHDELAGRQQEAVGNRRIGHSEKPSLIGMRVVWGSCGRTGAHRSRLSAAPPPCRGHQSPRRPTRGCPRRCLPPSLVGCGGLPHLGSSRTRLQVSLPSFVAGEITPLAPLVRGES